MTEYTEDFIAHCLSVLKANGGNAKNTSKQLGIPRTTLRQWAGRAASVTARPKQVSARAVEAADEANALRLDEIFGMVTEPELVRSKLDKASLRDLLISGDIATRGRALLRGQPTSRSESLRVQLAAPDGLSTLSLRVIEFEKRTEEGADRESA